MKNHAFVDYSISYFICRTHSVLFCHFIESVIIYVLPPSLTTPLFRFRLVPLTSVSAVMLTSSWFWRTSPTGCCLSSPRWRYRSLRTTGPDLCSPGPSPPPPPPLWVPLKATPPSPPPLCLLCCCPPEESWTLSPPHPPNPAALLQSSRLTRRGGTCSRWFCLRLDSTPTGPTEAWDSPTEHLPTRGCWVRAWHGPAVGWDLACRVWELGWDSACRPLRVTELPSEAQRHRSGSEPATLCLHSRSTDSTNPDWTELDLLSLSNTWMKTWGGLLVHKGNASVQIFETLRWVSCAGRTADDTTFPLCDDNRAGSLRSWL